MCCRVVGIIARCVAAAQAHLATVKAVNVGGVIAAAVRCNLELFVLFVAPLEIQAASNRAAGLFEVEVVLGIDVLNRGVGAGVEAREEFEVVGQGLELAFQWSWRVRRQMLASRGCRLGRR